MKLIGKLSGAAALMLALAGCISSDYTGREYPSIEARNVTFYQNSQGGPRDKTDQDWPLCGFLAG